MGKKYSTVATTAAYDFSIEPMFEVTAYEGIKPSRAKAIKQGNKALAMVLGDREPAANWKPKTDKRGRRPVIVAEKAAVPHYVEMSFAIDQSPLGKGTNLINVNQDWKVLGTLSLGRGSKKYTLVEGSEGSFRIDHWGGRFGWSYGFSKWTDVVYQFANLASDYDVEFTEALGLDPDLYPNRTGEWGLVLQDGSVVHEDGYVTSMGRVIGTVRGMWGKGEKYAHLPKFEYDRETGKARI